MIEQYILESDDLLEKTEHHLCCIPETPEKAGEHLAEALRLIHSFKGHSGLLGFRDFEQLSHKMESLLEYFRENTGNCDDAIRTLLLRGIDCLREGLSALSGDGSVPLPDIGPLVQMMDDARTAAGPSEPKQRPGKRRTSGEILRNMSARLSIDRRDIRVDLEKLDAMVNLVGELVIAESTVTKNPDLKGIPLDNFERSAHNLRRIISDLRHVVMSARMVPLAKTFRRMNRLVHDLSARSGKQIRLRLIGEETEVDKTVIERIVDPLVHLIRNSVDHGIESPEGRHRSGKPGTGTITLEAGHEGGEVLIRLSDDGRGLDREKILARAIGQGLISDDEARLTGQETDHLIFEPGFSTSEDVTDVSGRGIGLDVVRQNIEKLKGRTEVESTPDRGTTFCLRIPLTLAVIDGMLIRIGSACFTIPLLSIRKSFRPHRRQITVTMSGHEMVHIHNRLLPVIRLHRLYKIKPEHRALDAGILIHVTSGPKSVCLFADDIIGHHQTVIRGMPEYIGSAHGISGCTILDHGRIGLILDIGHIIDMVEKQSEGLPQQ
ncbi:chemotaxis protein CheA [Desulfonema ishimotonii]|uniref:Chemotaxis protein CheA n=2 Tax=Desulfonema ishimotonii TaxID=45657 RepID=A0A401FSV3_9BACT|nr:chemotaxis protein CheA [Desulfonema ishimotonii]